MNIKKEVENAIQNQFGNSGIEGVVKLMQMNYNMHGKAVKVTGAENEIKVDMQDKDLVEEYGTLVRIVGNPSAYNNNDVSQAKSLIQQFKSNLSQGSPQTAQDRQLFSNARVTKLTFYIGGLLVTSVAI